MKIRPPKPPAVVIMGPPGTGKTWSVGTLLAAGLEVFVLVTEPNGVDVLLDTVKNHGGDLSKLHWRTLSPAAPGWTALQKQAETAGTMSYADIQNIKAGVDKAHTKQYASFLKLCNNFIDNEGQEWGDVTDFGPDRAFVIDSLTGLNAIIMDQTIGYKPTAHQGEWGTSMNMQIKLLLKLTSDCQCFFVLIAHVDKELNEVTGISSVTIHALGRKNAMPIVGMFSEVVYAKKVKDQFFWSTVELNTDTKQRGLPLSGTIPPDFAQVVALHNRRLAEWKGSATAPRSKTATAA